MRMIACIAHGGRRSQSHVPAPLVADVVTLGGAAEVIAPDDDDDGEPLLAVAST